MDVLRELGFEVVLAEHALVEGDGGWDWRAGPPEDRAADINAMFADPDVRAIISSHGGHVANGVLAYLDYDLIAANPTIFMGFSNATWINLAIHARTGLVTFNGNMVMWHLGMHPTEYDRAEFRRVLVDAGSGPVPKNSVWHTVRDGPVGEGTLIGEATGFSRLAGTPYFPGGDSRLVLFVEGMADNPSVEETVLRHLDHIGLFERTVGLLIGNDGSGMTGRAPPVPLADLVLDVAAAYDFPVVKCDDFGHACPNTVLPNGVRARLDPETSSLEMLEAAVT